MQVQESQPTLTDYCIVRLGRRLYRSFPALFLDDWKPLPKRWTDPVSRWAKPKADYYYKNSYFYDDIYKRISQKQPVRFSVRKTFINPKLSSIYDNLAKAKYPVLISKGALLGYTGWLIWQQATKEKNSDSATKTTLHQIGRWVIGGEVGALCFDIGQTLSKQHWWLTSLITASLGAALFDFYWERLNPAKR